MTVRSGRTCGISIIGSFIRKVEGHVDRGEGLSGNGIVPDITRADFFERGGGVRLSVDVVEVER